MMSALLLLPLTGCVAHPANESASCPLPGLKPQLVVRLYFGRDIVGRAPVSDAEWDDFSRKVLTPAFPDGFTVLHGNGQWLDTTTHRIIREDSIVVEVAVASDSDFAHLLDEVSQSYRQQFRQDAVGVVTQAACARF